MRAPLCFRYVYRYCKTRRLSRRRAQRHAVNGYRGNTPAIRVLAMFEGVDRRSFTTIHASLLFAYPVRVCARARIITQIFLVARFIRNPPHKERDHAIELDGWGEILLLLFSRARGDLLSSRAQAKGDYARLLRSTANMKISVTRTREKEEEEEGPSTERGTMKTNRVFAQHNNKPTPVLLQFGAENEKRGRKIQKEIKPKKKKQKRKSEILL